MSVDIRPRQHLGHETTPVPTGPLARVVAGSLAAGLATALVLALVVFAGDSEATITGAMLVGFGAGWALMWVLTARLTHRAQRWTVVPAVAMSVSGLGLVALAPGNGAMTAISWLWPAPVLALAIWMSIQVRRNLPRRGRWLLAPVVAVLAIAPFAATYENIAVAHDRRTYAAPGIRYDVGGHRLHLDCHGQGSPTIVLENGLGEVTASWARIVAQVDITTRVCAYDRAGQGWSDEAAGARDGLEAGRDLHTLLRVAGEHGPYVLVGHSIGGTYAMTYAAQYPQQVAGMVLLDSSSPEQFTAIASYPGQYAVMRRALALTPTLDRFGLGRVVAAVAPSHLPASADDQVRAVTSDARGARNVTAEWSILPRVFEQAQALTTLGSRPLAVVTVTESLEKTGGWGAAQDHLATLSSNGVHQVVDSTHMGLLEDQVGSAAAVRAICHVVTTVRNDSAGGIR